jgi:thiamine biosynthesis lipoprotein
VYAKGKNPSGKNWTIAIEQLGDNKETTNPPKAFVKLKKLAIATSGNYRRFTVIDGEKYAHLIDSKTGFPTKNNLLSASIFSKDCIS